MKKRILAIILTIAMVISMVPAAMASEAPAEATRPVLDVTGPEGIPDGEITYISLGESMTNGYGMPGYYPGYNFEAIGEPGDANYQPADGYLPANVIDRMDTMCRSLHPLVTRRPAYKRRNIFRRFS